MKIKTWFKKLALGSALTFAATGAFAGAHGSIQHLNSGTVLPTTLPFSEIVVAGDFLFLSGQIGNLPGTLNIAPGGVEGQTRQVMDNIKTSLEANGYSMKHLIKCTVMLDDISQWNAFNDVYKTYFEAGKYPARAAFGADGLAIGAAVEVDCLGVR